MAQPQFLRHVGWVGEVVGLHRAGELVGNKYALMERISVGAMGVVYRATQAPTGLEVALKMVLPELLSPSIATRFEDEMKKLARLKHIGIVMIHDGGIHDDGRTGERIPYFAMEFVHGSRIVGYAKEHHLTAAILDRLLHKSVVMNIRGRSYRLQDLEKLLK